MAKRSDTLETVLLVIELLLGERYRTPQDVPAPQTTEYKQ